MPKSKSVGTRENHRLVFLRNAKDYKQACTDRIIEKIFDPPRLMKKIAVCELRVPGRSSDEVDVTRHI